MVVSRRYVKQIIVAFIGFLLERPISWLFGLGKFNIIYLCSEVLSFVIIYKAGKGLWRNIRKVMPFDEDSSGFLALVLVLCLLYSGWTLLDRTALYGCGSIEFRNSEDSYRYLEVWDNHQYARLTDNQVFDVYNEKVITYEEYVRRFQDGYYTAKYDETAGTMLIKKDGEDWFRFQVNDELEGWSWSPKQNYLLLNYYNNTFPELVDTKERKRLPIPTAKGIQGPWVYKGASGKMRELYADGTRAGIEWNSQENQAIIDLFDIASGVPSSQFYWNLKEGQYHYYSILGSEGPYLWFDKNGNLRESDSYDYPPSSGKWLNDTMVMADGGAGRSSSFAGDWGGWEEEGAVSIYGLDGKSLLPIEYRAYSFDIFSQNNLFGYNVNYTTGEIEKYRFRWFSLFYP